MVGITTDILRGAGAGEVLGELPIFEEEGREEFPPTSEGASGWAKASRFTGDVGGVEIVWPRVSLNFDDLSKKMFGIVKLGRLRSEIAFALSPP